MVTLDEVRESTEYLINNRPGDEVREYLREQEDDVPWLRYPAADYLYEQVEGATEYDDEHGSDDGTLDMGERAPALQLIHDVLAEAWHEKHDDEDD
jgi:hypothetical protein